MKMHSVNKHKGTTLNELEATIMYAITLFERKTEEKPSSGVIFCKGKPNELRLKYTDMVQTLISLQGKLGLEGCMSYGICKTCSKFDRSNFPGGQLGYCGGTLKHEYDSCSKHSKAGGGFGV